MTHYNPDLRGCEHPYKHHLWRLPDVPVARRPEPYGGQSRFAVLVIPLFQTNDGNTDLEHHIVRAACWARRSWVLFSDAVGLDIKIGFYVGDKVFDRVVPILEASGIDIDADVFVMDEASMEGDPETNTASHLGKKLAIFNDQQFADYEWVFLSDSDMFLSSPSRKQVQFFDVFRIAPEMPGAGTAKLLPDREPPFPHIRDVHWWRCLLHEQSDEEKLSAWLERAQALSNEQAVKAFTKDHRFFPTVHGALYAFPMRHYMREYPERCRWLECAGRSLQEDEGVFSLWFLKGWPLFNIAEEMNIPFCSDITQVFWAHAHADPVYFSHVGGLHEEWLWRDGFDGL